MYLGFLRSLRIARFRMFWISLDIGCLAKMAKPTTRLEKWSIIAASHQQKGQRCSNALGSQDVQKPLFVGIIVRSTCQTWCGYFTVTIRDLAESDSSTKVSSSNSVCGVGSSAETTLMNRPTVVIARCRPALQSRSAMRFFPSVGFNVYIRRTTWRTKSGNLLTGSPKFSNESLGSSNRLHQSAMVFSDTKNCREVWAFDQPQAARSSRISIRSIGEYRSRLWAEIRSILWSLIRSSSWSWAILVLAASSLLWSRLFYWCCWLPSRGYESSKNVTLRWRTTLPASPRMASFSEEKRCIFRQLVVENALSNYCTSSSGMKL